MKVRHEINMMDREFSTISGSFLELIYLATSLFSGSCTFYCEIVAKNTDSLERYVYLRNTNDANEATVTIPANTTTWTRIRTSSFTPDDDYPEKFLFSTIVYISVLAARIIIIQDTSTSDLTDCETQIEIGDYESVASETEGPLTYPKYWHYDSSKWDGTLVFYAECTYLSEGTMDAITIKVEEDNGSFGSWADKITIVNAGVATVPTRVRSAAFTPTTGRNYRISMFCADDMDPGTIYNAKIIVEQTGAGINQMVKAVGSLGNIYGGSGTLEALGQSFTTIGAISVDKIAFGLRRLQNPTDNLYIEIAETIDGATISNGTSDDVDISAVGISVAEWVEFSFPTPPSLDATTEYFIRVFRDGSRDVSNCMTIYGSGSSLYADGKRYLKESGSWDSGSATIDYGFKVYSTTDKITKLEPVMLLQNTGKSATGLQGYDQYWDDDEWGGVTLTVLPEHDGGVWLEDEETVGAYGTPVYNDDGGIGQSFQTVNGGQLDSLVFKCTRSGTLGNCYAKIYNHSGTFGTSSVPTGSALATSDAVAIADIGISAGDIIFNFSGSDRIILDPSTYYVVVCGYVTDTDYVSIAFDQSDNHGGNYCTGRESTSWSSNSGYDTIFKVFLAPVTKLQEDVDDTPSDVSNSEISGLNRTRGATGLSITDNEDIDTYLVAA